MRLLERVKAGKFRPTKDFVGDDETPPYAILSHTWSADTEEEVTFNDLMNGSGERKPGYEKINFCGEQAKRDGLRHFWVDTCCIDKSNNTELSEAINSMFRWYQNSVKCYVYLSDVSTAKRKASDRSFDCTWESAFRESRWFTRGWTLQELLAPTSVEFFSRECKRLGDKRSLERQIHEVTKIAVAALQETTLYQFGVDERFLWARHRQTTRKEDKAYSLLGMFDVSMSLIYGEGEDNAFARLREAIDKPSKALDRLPCAVDAPFNSYAKQDSPSCLPGTRVDLLQEIYAWAERQDEPRMFWLNGLAGTGKSTIARTVARRYFDQKWLGASFFFSRGGGDVGRADKFVTSIAAQLANSVRTLRRYISDALTEHSDVASRSLHDQWQLLILGPLSKLDSNSCRNSHILVVDALDECDGDNTIRTIVQLLSEARLLERVNLRVFLTSRPEVPIRYSLCQMPRTGHYDFVLHNISPSIIDHDISVFLAQELKLIGEEDFQDAGWPGAEAIHDLVQSASGLFIWAATACRFIREGLFADERLRIILERDASAATASPEEHLNGIYITVLRNSLQSGFCQRDRERFCFMLRDILGSVVTLFSPLSVDSLSRLLNTPKQRVDRMLKDLHAILDISNDSIRPLRLHHPSFRDFLLDKNRCGDSNFNVEEKQAHRTLAERCIQLLSTSLKEDICDAGRPGVLVAEIESSQVQRCLPPEVQYACLHWIQHLQKSGFQLQDNDQVHQFLQKHLLHWLEALCWMRRISDGIRAINILNLIPNANEHSTLQAFIYDIKRFALFSRPGIEQAPLQTLYGALIFAPAMSRVREQFEDQMPRWVTRVPDAGEHWNALLQALEGHSGAVMDVAFSPDGKKLASSSRDHTIRLWDVESGARLLTLKGHNKWVNTVAFSPDSTRLASGSNDKTIRLWNTASGVILWTHECHGDFVCDVAFSPDSKWIASGSYDRTVRLWCAESGADLQTFEGHSSQVKAVAFSLDNKRLASASRDGTVRLWEVESRAELLTFKAYEDNKDSPRFKVAISPDFRRLASASALKRSPVTLLDLESGAEPLTLRSYDTMVSAITFSSDSKRLALALQDNTIRVWDAELGGELITLETHGSLVEAIAFSQDGQLLASGSYDDTVRLWEVKPEAKLQKIKGYPDTVRTIAFSPDGKRLASASHDGTVRLWNVESGALLHTFEGYEGWQPAIAFSPDSKILASASYEHTVKLWNAESGAELQILSGHKRVVSSVTFSPDSKRLASASYDHTIRIWDVDTGVELLTFDGHTDRVACISFSPDGTRLLSGSGDMTVRLWDIMSGKALQKLEGHSESVIAIVFSPCSNWLASASFDCTVKLWDADLGVELQTLEDHYKGVTAVAFSPDGKRLASASWDRTVRLWDVESGTELRTLRPEAPIRQLSFSEDGSYIYTDRGIVRLDQPPSNPTELRSQDLLELFVSDEWVVSGSQNVLWLPTEYRATCVAVHEQRVVLGHGSGRVTFLKFDHPILHGKDSEQ